MIINVLLKNFLKEITHSSHRVFISSFSNNPPFLPPSLPLSPIIIYVCRYVLYVCLYVCNVYIYLSACTHGCLFVHMYVCLLYVYMYVCMYACRCWSRPNLTAVTAFGCEKTGTQKNIFLWKTNLYLSQKDHYLHQS